MHEFLVKTLSNQRAKTYIDLAKKDKFGRSADRLYQLNILYSKELYVVLGGLEVSVRNAFHGHISQMKGKQDWFSLGLLKPKHEAQVNSAIEHLIREKNNNYILDDVVAQLNFGFWVHLCDRPYEKTLWNKALYKSFPHLGMKPSRQDIEARLRACHRIRNKIAHLEPIIKYEETLIQDYRNILQLLYAICPDTQKWFENICKFESVWEQRSKGVLE